MPYKIEKIKLVGLQDRRRKLTDEQKKEILLLSKTMQQKDLAAKYNVSKDTIALITNPERAKRVKQRIKEHWMDYKVDKPERNRIMREHRHYKHQLLK